MSDLGDQDAVSLIGIYTPNLPQYLEGRTLKTLNQSQFNEVQLKETPLVHTCLLYLLNLYSDGYNKEIMDTLFTLPQPQLI
jgi:hypothetical protein